MKKTGFFVLTLFLAASVFTFYYLNSIHRESEPVREAPPLQRLPVEEKQTASPLPSILQADIQAPENGIKPLPPLGDADEEAGEWLANIFPQIGPDEVFIRDHLIERFVLWAHSLTESRLPLDKIPFKPASGPFEVRKEADKIYLSPENYRRYAPFIRLAEGFPLATAAKAYVRLYPLLQKAFTDLGVSSGLFHDRLLEVMDHLIATPEVQEPILLVQPHVLYQFADPELESLSAGRKILIRMGPENAAIVKKKLIEAKELLVQ